MKHLSYWEKAAFKNHDIAIIGAGLVGTIAAIKAKRKYPKKSVALIERSTLPSGASTKNAGFACFGSISEMSADLENSSSEDLEDLIKKRWEGLQLLQSYIPHKRAAELTFSGGYEMFKKDESDTFKHYSKQIPYFNQLIFQATGLENCFSTVDENFGLNCHPVLIKNQYEGQLNPVRLMQALIAEAISLGVHTFYGMELESWLDSDGISLSFKDGEQMYCDQLILTTNAFTNQLVEGLDLKPYRNQVLITNPIKKLKLKGIFHYNKGYTYFRNVGTRVLLGGFRDLDYEGEQTTDFGLTETIQEAQEKFLKETLNVDAQIAHRWSGILATGHSKNAIIKQLSEHVYLGVRLGGMGIAIGAQVAHDTISMIKK